MEHSEIYRELFQDSFLSGLIFPWQNEMVLANMLIFLEDAGYDKVTMFILALLASLLAFTINYYAGRLFLREASITKQMKEGYNKISNFSKKYMWWLLLFSWIDIYGTFLPLFAGMLRLKYRYVILLSGLGKAIYYVIGFKYGLITVQH